LSSVCLLIKGNISGELFLSKIFSSEIYSNLTP
jgi:hypothetical protein